MRLSWRKESVQTHHWTPPQRAVLISLIGLQVVAYAVQLALSFWDRNFVVDYLGLSARGIDHAYSWQFFTAPLLHSSFWQFLASTLFLGLIGRDVEAIIGQRKFLFLYFFGASLGEFGHLFFMPAETVLFAGTGGVAAVVAAYATLLPQLNVSHFIPLRVGTAMKITLGGAIILLLFVRHGVVGHSAFLGGAAAGTLYTHLLGYGRTSFLQRYLHRRARERARWQMMDAREFLTLAVDPVLEKIAVRGLSSLSRRERKLLAQAREKILLENGI